MVDREALPRWCYESRSLDPDTRRRAEESLAAAARRQDFLEDLVSLTTETHLDNVLRLAVARYLQGLVGNRWYGGSSSLAPIEVRDDMALAQRIVDSVSYDAAIRIPAQAYLANAAKRPGFFNSLLRLITDSSIQEDVRIPIACQLKRYTLHLWYIISPSFDQCDHPDVFDALTDWFLGTLEPTSARHHLAVSSLSAAADHPRFTACLLALIAAPDPPTRPIHDSVRLAAAINVKNLVHNDRIPAPYMGTLKTTIDKLLLVSKPAVRRQLIQAISIICGTASLPPQLDFTDARDIDPATPPNADNPAISSWPSLFPALMTQLCTATNAGRLSAANDLLVVPAAIFSMSRHHRPEYNFFPNFAFELWATFGDISSGNSSVQTDPLLPGFDLPQFLQFRCHCFRIFYSFCCKKLQYWINEGIALYLSDSIRFLHVLESDHGIGDDHRAAVCDILFLCIEKDVKLDVKIITDFESRIACLLMRHFRLNPEALYHEQFVHSALRFLTVARTTISNAHFSGDHVLYILCYLLPTVGLTPEDQEQFKIDYTEYIRRDTEALTLRHTCCELLKRFRSSYREEVTALVSFHIHEMLALCDGSPDLNWRYRDTAIYLVMQLTGNANEAVFPLPKFFKTVIYPELRAQDVNTNPVLKADALKCFTLFLDRIPKDTALTTLPHLIRILLAQSNVVHSYAANCIEKLLLVKDSVHGPNAVMSHPRYVASDIDPCLASLAGNLFEALQQPDSQENPYVMKCIMRVLGMANVGREVATLCITRLALLLDEARKNPKDPYFSHHLFESIAALIGRCGERDPSLIGVFETHLFPVLQNILTENVVEFRPYIFQIFAQLVDKRSLPLSDYYMQLFSILLMPETWQTQANAPALVRLLQAYLQKVPNELKGQGRLNLVLDRSSKLISSSNTEDLGYYVLSTLVENLGYDVIAPYIGDIWSALLQNPKRTLKSVNSLVIFMSRVLVKYGTNILVDTINAVNKVQPNLFNILLQKYWIPSLRLISGTIERKLALVAATRLICESPLFYPSASDELLGKMLDSIVTLLGRPVNDGVELELNVPEVPENVGYLAGRRQEDPLQDIKDTKEFFIVSLTSLSAATPGRFPALIQNYVDPANHASLLQLCGSYNCTIV